MQPDDDNAREIELALHEDDEPEETDPMSPEERRIINEEAKAEEELTEDDRMAEFMILGLRMTRGVSEEEFRSRFGRQTDERYGAVIQKHLRSGLLERAGDRIRLSRRGISLANVVMADFLPE